MSKTSFVHQLQQDTNIKFKLLRPLLYFASLAYGSITAIRNFCYKHQLLKSNRLHVPVISVGNITAGGTGKTPTVIWLVENLPTGLSKTILLSRGYGGDEEKIFAKSLPETPHFIGSKRFLSGQRAIKEYGSKIIFLLDDAFQHRQLHRNINIVLIDATCPFGYEYILPRGFLRESLKNLQRADAFIITRSDMVKKEQIIKIQDKLNKIAGNKLQLLSQHTASHFLHHTTKKIKSLAEFTGKKAYLFCGIGNPESFRHLIEKQNITVTTLRAFDDHYQYTNEDLIKIHKEANSQKVDIIITTSKDAVKIPKQDNSIWILEIKISIEKGKEELMEMISKKIEHSKM